MKPIPALPLACLLSFWLNSPAWSADATQIEQGRQVFMHWCASCHAPGDRGVPGTLALKAKYKGTDIPAVLEQRRDLSLDFLKYFVRNGASIMPFFRKTEVSDADLSAMAAYLSQSANQTIKDQP